MSTVIRTEKRRRTIFGTVIKWVFICFNVLMLMWFIDASTRISQMTVDLDAGRVGQAIGATLGFSFLFGIWTAGVILLGVFVLLTRGDKIITEETTARSNYGFSQDAGLSNVDPGAVVARYVKRQQADERIHRSTPTPSEVGFGRRR